MGNDREIAMNFFDEVSEFVGRAEAGKIRAAGWVESLAERDAFFQEFERFAAFAEMLLRGGHDVERGGAVGKIREKFFDGVDLGASFGGVGGFGGSAANLVLCGLLAPRANTLGVNERGQGKDCGGDRDREEAKPGEDSHHSDFRREHKDVASSRMAPRRKPPGQRIVGVHPGVLSKECGSC